MAWRYVCVIVTRSAAPAAPAVSRLVRQSSWVVVRLNSPPSSPAYRLWSVDRRRDWCIFAYLVLVVVVVVVETHWQIAIPHSPNRKIVRSTSTSLSKAKVFTFIQGRGNIFHKFRLKKISSFWERQSPALHRVSRRPFGWTMTGPALEKGSTSCRSEKVVKSQKKYFVCPACNARKCQRFSDQRFGASKVFCFIFFHLVIQPMHSWKTRVHQPVEKTKVWFYFSELTGHWNSQCKWNI